MEDAYAAGFMDGEGTIRAFVRERRGRKEIQLEIAVYNTHAGVIEALQGVFGGRVKMKRAAKRPVHCLIWDKKSEAKNLLEKVEPHLIVKRTQAIAMLEFLERHHEGTRARQTERDFELVGIIQAANALSRWRPPVGGAS